MQSAFFLDADAYFLSWIICIELVDCKGTTFSEALFVDPT